MKAETTPTIPLYRSVYETILDRIITGVYGPGAMLPSEVDLGAELGVSQGTARKALIELEHRGIVQRRQGRGTFVATTTPESALFHFFRLRRKDGAECMPRRETEQIKHRLSTKAERVAFDHDEKHVFEISRLRSIDGKKIIRETAVLPASLFPGIADRSPLPNALYALYQQSYGIVIARADEQLHAVLASADDAAKMDVKAGSPMIEVSRRAIDISDRCVEVRLSRYVTDDLRYVLELS
jgi:GntR family transcriptional regulator